MKISVFVASLAIASLGGFLVPRAKPQEKKAEEPRQEGRIKLTDERRAAGGIDVVKVEQRTLPELIHTTGTVEVNADRVAHLGPRLPGIALEISAKANLGQKVTEGDLLVAVHSLEFGRAQVEFLKATKTLELRQKTHDREKELFDRKISSGREFIEAEADLAQTRIDLEAARHQLEVAGMSKEEIDGLLKRDIKPGCMSVRAPIAGTIIEKHVVRGEHLDTERNLFTIADLGQLWILADIYERDLARITQDLQAEVQIAAWPDKVFAGRTTHVAETMSTETRTLKVRIEVDNKDGKLKPGMFATVFIAVGERKNVICVPESAIQTQKQLSIVFVEIEKNAFDRKLVRTGARFGGFVEILEGIPKDARVVTSGSFLLKSELEKESFGGGD